MGAADPWVIPLSEAAAAGERLVGGKASKLSMLIGGGYRVPDGFCISTAAYRRFIESGRLKKVIDMETRRKSMAKMRWEEIWDAALRIRTAFLRTPIPDDVSRAILESRDWLIERSRQIADDTPLAVRSSAVGEDSAEKSYAGLHESLVGVVGDDALHDAVRVVWASLWSDAALLYRRELALDAGRSAMAVVVQTLFSTDRSGVGFGRDPRNLGEDRQVIEAVPGLCQNLVDGAVDPDRWIVQRSDGTIVEWRPGERSEPDADPLLGENDIGLIHTTLNDVESRFGWPPDIEWTGRGNEFTLLQARPVTTASPSADEEKREWYLSLRPGRAKLEALCRRVTEELIPRLEDEGRRLADETIEELDDAGLAEALADRAETHARWKKTYWDEFIPFAHGVRQLGQYYNDAVKPGDSYEFIEILKDQPMIAARRNAALAELSDFVRKRPALYDLLRDAAATAEPSAPGDVWPALRATLGDVDGGREFEIEFERFRDGYMDVVYDGEKLDGRPDIILHTLAEMAGLESRRRPDDESGPGGGVDFEQRLLDAVGPGRHDEARSVIEIARLSWRLRDDDNVLLGRVEKQLLRAVDIAVERLQRSGRLSSNTKAGADSAAILAGALQDSTGGEITLKEPDSKSRSAPDGHENEKPRQIVGQPASPGLATATARVIRSPGDLGAFTAGEILVCDAIQPTMSHVVPLAAAIVERRGGMLIHGAIIARELGIPCVNGVSEAILSIADGEILTVDGYLGIVTIGPPEFDLETGAVTDSVRAHKPSELNKKP